MSSNEAPGAAETRAAPLTAPGQFALTTRSLDPREGWATLQVLFTGICGSDFPIYEGTHPRARLPLVLGHETVAKVIDPGNSRVPVGSLVAVNPLRPCGACGACEVDLPHLCRSLRLHGIDFDGSMAETMIAPPESLVPFGPDVPPQVAALAEPLAVAVHAVNRARIAPAEPVLIFGAGPIGILIALVAAARGASEITLVEPNEHRREIARNMGFVAVRPGALPAARDAGDLTAAAVSFDCAGHPSVARDIVGMTRVRGRVVVVAVHHGHAEIDLRELAFAEQEVLGVRVYTHADFRDAVDLISSDALGLERLPVSIFPLDLAAEAFQEARAGDKATKVLISSQQVPA